MSHIIAGMHEVRINHVLLVVSRVLLNIVVFSDGFIVVDGGSWRGRIVGIRHGRRLERKLKMTRRKHRK